MFTGCCQMQPSAQRKHVSSVLFVFQDKTKSNCINSCSNSVLKTVKQKQENQLCFEPPYSFSGRIIHISASSMWYCLQDFPPWGSRPTLFPGISHRWTPRMRLQYTPLSQLVLTTGQAQAFQTSPLFTKFNILGTKRCTIIYIYIYHNLWFMIRYLFNINLQGEEVTLVVLFWLEISGCDQNLQPFKEWNRSVCIAFLRLESLLRLKMC